MKTYTGPTVQNLDESDRKVIQLLVAEVLEATRDTGRSDPFYFEYRNAMVMFAPDTHFFADIPDAPLPSIGAHVDGNLILAGQSAANDRLPLPSEDFLL